MWLNWDARIQAAILDPKNSQPHVGRHGTLSIMMDSGVLGDELDKQKLKNKNIGMLHKKTVSEDGFSQR